MNLNELYGLYQSLNKHLQEHNYTVDENGILTLYYEMVNGKSSRKDFLIFAIKDMLFYINSNNIDNIKSTLMLKFKRIYLK